MESSFATSSIARRSKRLLKSLCEIFQFLVAVIQFFLDLLEFSLEASVLIFCNIISDFQISIMILQVFFLHLDKVIERLCLRLLLDSKDHFSQLLSLVIVKMTWLGL